MCEWSTFVWWLLKRHSKVLNRIGMEKKTHSEYEVHTRTILSAKYFPLKWSHVGGNCIWKQKHIATAAFSCHNQNYDSVCTSWMIWWVFHGFSSTCIRAKICTCILFYVWLWSMNSVRNYFVSSPNLACKAGIHLVKILNKMKLQRKLFNSVM